MKKIFLLCLLMLLSIQIAQAISQEDKMEIDSIIEKWAKYGDIGQGKTYAMNYIDDKYGNGIYRRCQQKCIEGFTAIKRQPVKWGILGDENENIRKANQFYTECMANDCDDILNITAKECYEYINNYKK